MFYRAYNKPKDVNHPLKIALQRGPIGKIIEELAVGLAIVDGITAIAAFYDFKLINDEFHADNG